MDGKDVVAVLLLNRQIVFYLFFGDGVIKRQQDIRCFVLAGIHLERRPCLAVFQRKRLCGKQYRDILLAVLCGHRLHHRLNALLRPVPFGQLAEPLGFNIPAAAPVEVGLYDIRHKHPQPRVNDPGIHPGHRAEVQIDVAERLLHALADAGILNRELRLSAHNKVNIPTAKLPAADHGNIAWNLHLAFDDGVGTHAEIQMLCTIFRTRAAECAQLDGGVQYKYVYLSAWQIQFKGLGACQIDAPVGRSVVSPLLSVELEGIAKTVNDGRICANNAHFAGREGYLAGADDHISLALNEMEIGALQRAPQLEGRDGEIIAVHRVGQIAEARAAAVELPNGHRRNEGDAGACRHIEVQRIGEETAVRFAAHQLQLRLGLKEVKGIQFQLERIFLLTFEGIDLALDLRQLQRQRLGRVKAARGVDAVDRKFVFLI